MRKAFSDEGERSKALLAAYALVSLLETPCSGTSTAPVPCIAVNVGEFGASSAIIQDIEAIIWSHSHFDHVGDPSTFPPSTDLIVSPGFKKAPESGLLDSDTRGRNFREIEIRRDDCLKIGRFDAMGFFFW